MAEFKHGELQDWNEAEVKGGGNDFMKLQEGDNVVRIFTSPYQFHVCWVKDVSGANKKLRSSGKNCQIGRAHV